MGKRKRRYHDNHCIDCGVEIGDSSKRCKDCSHIAMWADPVIGNTLRAKLSERNEKIWSDEDFRKRTSERVKLESTERWVVKRDKMLAGVRSEHCHNAMSIAAKARWANKDSRKAIIDAQNAGRNTSGWKKANSDMVRNLWKNPKYRKTMSDAHKISSKLYWKNNPEKRLEFSRRMSGSNHPNWKGLDKEYDLGFNYEFRYMIRKKYNFRCAVCGKSEYGKALDVHHIDFDKKHSTDDNCIALCRSCHTKTSHDRDMHRVFLEDIVLGYIKYNAVIGKLELCY